MLGLKIQTDLAKFKNNKDESYRKIIFKITTLFAVYIATKCHLISAFRPDNK